ncbi:His Kinase A (phospho-acceptor) domain-containing protein [Fibrobacter sp. UWB12]|nr:His Kinase A (phospho-acceptor) domain-containing protein [Fibrobacter sp. UWB12]
MGSFVQNFQKTKKKNRRLKYSIIRFAPLILVVYWALAAFSTFQKEDKIAVTARNKDYIKDITLAMASKLDEIFSNSVKSIEALANLSSDDAESNRLSGDYLTALEKMVQFDHVHFTDATGQTRTSSNDTIYSGDKWFFSEGMNGNSGIYVMMPTNSSMAYIVFYAPVQIQGKVVGILSSSFDEKTITRLLEYKVYGASASAGIVNTEGKSFISLESMKIQQTSVQGQTRHSFKSFLYTAQFDNENRNNIIRAYTTRTPSSYTFKGDTDEIHGYIAPLQTVPLCVYSNFPTEAAKSLYSMGIKAGRMLQFLLIVIFVGYIIYLLLIQFYIKRVESRENYFAGYIAKAESEIARAMIYVDAENGTYEDLSSMALPFPKKGNLDDLEQGFIQINDDLQNGDDFRHFFETVIKERKIHKRISSVVFRSTIPDGCPEYFTMAYIPVQVKLNVVYKGIILFRNITAEKSKEIEANQKLSFALAAAREASKAKTTFLFNMSHDIRTPMNAVTGFTAMAKKHLDEPEMVKEYLDKIDIAGKQLLSLVNQVLEMSRIESGKITLKEQTCDIQNVITALMTTYGTHAESKGIRFTATIANVEHRFVSIDSDRINQITANIIGNAIKYTLEGGSINCTVNEHQCDREGYGLYTMVVEDTGIGMTPEFQKHIFDEFTRETSTTVSNIQGTGLGMTIVKKLIDLMDGTIDIESQKGKGTKITFSIPMKWSKEATANVIEKIDVKPQSLKGMRVLLVEDNEMNREIAQELLEENGIVVDTAEDGDIAVQKIRNSSPQQYELILMDVQMPHMNGYDATREIRALNDPQKSSIPIIAMTANAFEEDKKNALDAGMNGHLAKPIDVQKLIQTLTEFRSN